MGYVCVAESGVAGHCYGVVNFTSDFDGSGEAEELHFDEGFFVSADPFGLG